jgi:hypothetical protein
MGVFFMHRLQFKLIFCLAAAISIGLAPVSEGFACRYTVRDVAFVELGDPGYLLAIYVDQETPAEQADLLREAAQIALLDSNVGVEVVPMEGKSTSEFLNEMITRVRARGEALASDNRAIEYPLVELVAPDGRALEIPFSAAERSDGKLAGKKFRGLVHSDWTDRLLPNLMQEHSMVLLVESADSEKNQEAREWADECIERIKNSLEDLPKPIDLPPRLVVLSMEDARSEEVLLWSLGVERGPERPTQIAILFGRGRKLGPVLRLPETSQNEVLYSLAIVGQDCECGLDRIWMRGVMIPHVWTSLLESQAVEFLGFDPGSPMVKSEISRILARGPASYGPRSPGARPAADSLLPGLQIIELNVEQGHLSEAGSVTDGDEIEAGETGGQDEGAETTDQSQQESSVAADSPAEQTGARDEPAGEHADQISAAAAPSIEPSPPGAHSEELAATEPKLPASVTAPVSAGQHAAVDSSSDGSLSKDPPTGPLSTVETMIWVLVVVVAVAVAASAVLLLRGRRRST